MRTLAYGVLVLVVMFWIGIAWGAGAARQTEFGVFSVPNDRRALAELETLGVGWVRQQFRIGDPRRDRRTRRFIEKILPHLLTRGIGLWATLYHRDPSNIVETGTVGFRDAERGGFPPRDPMVYQTLIRRTVGDFREAIVKQGRAPARWLVVQFGNEVLPRDVHPPDRPVRFWHGTADQYLDMLALGYDAVKSVDPAIPIAAGGISSAAMEAIRAGNRPVMAWNDRLLREGKFDIAAVHLRHRLADVPRKVHWVRKRWRGLLAATELAGPDPRVTAFTETAQARDLRSRMTLAYEAGIDWIFWAALADSPFVRPVHRHEGLIEPDAWRRKPAFETYRKLIGELRP